MEFEPKDLVAGYAAVLSTIVFIWNWRNSKPKFSVEILPGTANVDDEYIFGAYVFIKNPSNHKVNISNISLLYPYRETSFFKETESMLRDGDSFSTRCLKIWREIKRALHWKESRYRYWVHTHFPFEGIDTGLPRTIEARDAHKIFIPETNLKDVLAESTSGLFAAVAQNSLWDRSYSAPFKLHYK